ncbi:acyltransferase [Xylophilus sp. GOD-11R]|uniref:acyltransferase family protein n=1 Tax=Xylophilus sp. GOD-11R TaxID=3089814 RepID=UPI00298BFC9F|nr:acyltransferase [Xylophilus sp. GOD-11R]WPB54980.1 acyltransferase [Xylophilus sp. GOD-11R]
MNQYSRSPIYGLDLVRFISAMLVLGWHLAYRFFDPFATYIRSFTSGIPAQYQAIQEFTRWGWVGVEIFFVVSGLVIAYSAQNGGSAWKFFLGRLGRLLPGVFVCALIVLVIDIAIWNMPLVRTVQQFAKTIFFWPMGDWIVPQFWTLPIEIAFYGVVWLMIFNGFSHHLDRLAVGLCVWSAVYWAAVSFRLWHVTWLDNLLLLQQGFYFAVGISLASIDRAGASPARIAVLLCGILLGPIEIAFAVHKYNVYSAETPMAWIFPYAIWFAFVACIALSLYWKRELGNFVMRGRGRFGAALRILGLATFPLYLIHIHVGGLVISLLTSARVPPIPATVIGILACIPVAMAVAAWCEPPLRKLLLRPFLPAVQRGG